ncbi:putative protein N(5)-glutamine methyltransferase [Cellulomonas sp. P5_E12]
MTSHAEITATLRAAGCVFAEDEATILLDASGDLDSLVARRVAGEPLEVVVGWAEFCGLRIEIDPGVFVPRRRTELLVREAARLAPSGHAVVVDLCCGSGALGVALASVLPSVSVYSADVEPAAVRCARRNVATVGGQVFEGDLDAPLPDALLGRVDLLLANVPYVPSEAIDTMPPEARLYEPLVTLDGGADGLDVLRRVASVAPRWLAPGGHLLVETSEAQVPAASAAFEAAGLAARVVSDEESGGTVLVGTVVPSLVERLVAMADPERAAGMAQFFKTGPGDYGEGDVFLGLSVPQVVSVARTSLGLPIGALEALLEDERHEVRLLALKVMALECAARRSSADRRAALLDLYLRRTDRVNNWDLVDASAPDVLGRAVLGGLPAAVLYRLAESSSLWERRISIVATLPLVRAGSLDDTFALAALLEGDRHDLMHKAVGWLLREAGKKDEARLLAFLDEHAATLPRTALRYSLERLSPSQRAHYMAARSALG